MFNLSVYNVFCDHCLRANIAGECARVSVGGGRGMIGRYLPADRADVTGFIPAFPKK